MKSANSGRKYRKDTLVAHLGRHPEAQNGTVNPPVYHASTILSANMAEWEAKRDPSTRFDIVRYGLLGTPTTFALEEAVAAIEGGYRAMLMSSGLAAVTAPLQACLKCGDHVLMVDSCYGPARTMAADLGHCAGPDDAYYALRGLRTLSVRLERHEKNALAVARWLQTRPEVSRVLYPALPEDPGYELWKRDFLGASGLFGIVLKPASKSAVYAMIDTLDLFGIGSSWGGYESLILPTNPVRGRTATRWG